MWPNKVMEMFIEKRPLRPAAKDIATIPLRELIKLWEIFIIQRLVAAMNNKTKSAWQGTV